MPSDDYANLPAIMRRFMRERLEPKLGFVEIGEGGEIKFKDMGLTDDNLSELLSGLDQADRSRTTNLFLRQNKLTRFPDMIMSTPPSGGVWTNLTGITLCDNRLAHLPDSLGLLVGLPSGY